MTKGYQIFSRAYRIGLGLFCVFYIAMSTFFRGFANENDPSNVWILLFGILTITTTTALHRLGNENGYKVYIQIFACLLALISLGFVLYILFSALHEADGNLLVNTILTIATFVNAMLLFYLINDRKYSAKIN